MSKEQLNEMKRLRQLMESLSEAPDNDLVKASQLMQDVVDGLGREWEDLVNTGGEEDAEAAESVDSDMNDYRKIAELLAAGKGKQAAKVYDGLDTVSREYVYDHLESDEIEYMQKVFGKLGSMWLYPLEDDYFEEGVGAEHEEDETCLYCGGPHHADDCREYDGLDEEATCNCGREGCECGPDCSCEPVEEDKDTNGMYDVTVSINGEYPEESETAVDYDTAVATAKDIAEAWKKGRWQMQTWNKGDAKEWHVRGDDGRMEEWFVVIRVEPSDDADEEEWQGESIKLGKIAEAAIAGTLFEDDAVLEVEEEFKLPMGMELVDEDADDDFNDGVIDDDDIDRLIDVGDDEDYEYNDDLDLDNLGFSVDLDD